MKLDETDLNIIALLKENGRIQNNDIASRLSISEGTVRNRIKKLIDNDFLSIRGLVNPEKPGYEEIKKVDMETGIYKKIVLDQGKIVGAIVLGETKSIAPLMKLIDQRNDVSVYKDAILEDNFDFRKVLSLKRT